MFRTLRRSLPFVASSALVLGATCLVVSTVEGQRGRGASRRPRPSDDEMQVEGLLGTLPRDAARSAVARKQSRFLACYANRARDVDVLAGRIDLVFRVATDGSVKNVRIASSTVGDRETERCVRTEATSVRFPAPQGGEAEVTDRIDVPVPADVRPASAWPTARVASVVRSLSSAKRGCRVGNVPVEVTVYVGPGGDVLAAGAAPADGTNDGPIECVLERVRSASFPDPGSYPAKVAFTL